MPIRGPEKATSLGLLATITSDKTTYRKLAKMAKPQRRPQRQIDATDKSGSRLPLVLPDNLAGLAVLSVLERIATSLNRRKKK
jgi:hypothetical protein